MTATHSRLLRRNRLGAISLLLLGLSGVGFWAFCSRSLSRDDSSAPATVKQVADAEEWVAAARAAGSGILRIPKAGDEPQRDIVVDATPRFSEEGCRMLADSLQLDLADAEAKLAARIGEEAGASPIEEYEAELRTLVEFEKVRAMLDLFSQGAYLVMAPKQKVPPTPPGALPVWIGPWPLSDGQVGQALFFIQKDKRPTLRSATAALSEVLNADRGEHVRQFNAKPDQERRAWVDRYFLLKDRVAAGGLVALTTKELEEYLGLEKEVSHLRVTVRRDSASLLPR